MTYLSKLIPSARGLFVFEAAARTGSFTATASEFNVTQPSISRSIAQLEADLGFRLFERRPTGLELTAEGSELHLAVRQGLNLVGESVRAIRDRQQARKPVVTLSLSSSFVTHWLVSRLSEFNRAFPDVDLRFDLTAGRLAGLSDSVDLATRLVANDDDTVHRWDFAPEIIVPVCSPSYLRDHETPVEGKSPVFLNLFEQHKPLWQTILRDENGATVLETANWLEFPDYAVVLQAALNGEGVALGWISVVSTALLRGALMPASDRVIRTGGMHRLVAPRSRPLRRVVTEIAQWLQNEMAKELDLLRCNYPSLFEEPLASMST